MPQSVAVSAVEVVTRHQGVHLVHPDVPESCRIGLDLVQQDNRFPIREGHDDVGPRRDVVKNRWGGRWSGGRVQQPQSLRP